MSKIQNWALRKYVAVKAREEEGQGLAEYGLILALIAVVCVVALRALGTGLSGTINGLVTDL